MFEHTFYTKMRFVLSEFMLHKKMRNARTDVTHEYEIFVRNYATYENIICPNLCCTRKYDVLCLFENVYCPFQFYFYRIWTSAQPRLMINGIWQSLCLDLVNVNVYANFNQNIPKGSRDRASFTF